jgi:hypothetical protein
MIAASILPAVSRPAPRCCIVPGCLGSVRWQWGTLPGGRDHIAAVQQERAFEDWATTCSGVLLLSWLLSDMHSSLCKAWT